MAPPKKGSRAIVVSNVKYRWRAIGADGGIRLVVWPDSLPGPSISCSFDYDQRCTQIGDVATLLTQQVVITSRIVRRVIEHAVNELDYDAKHEGKALVLRRASEVSDMADELRSA